MRRGELHLVVERYEGVRRRIEQLVGEAGGYVAKSTVDHQLGRVSSATLVVRVPAAAFGGIVGRIEALGTLTHQAMDSEDITEQYFDLDARLRNARRLEARLLELLAKQAGKVSDLLEVERELSRVRETIERFTGKLHLYDDLVALSTLAIHLRIDRAYVPPKPPTLGQEIGATLRRSWASLVTVGRGLVLALVALLPWAVPLGIVTWLVVRWLRRRRQRRGSPPGRAAH